MLHPALTLRCLMRRDINAMMGIATTSPSGELGDTHNQDHQ